MTDLLFCDHKSSLAVELSGMAHASRCDLVSEVISKASKLSGYNAERIQKLAIREFLNNNDDFVTQGHRQDYNSGLLSETTPRLELLN